jgi:hypothetical protein
MALEEGALRDYGARMQMYRWVFAAIGTGACFVGLIEGCGGDSASGASGTIPEASTLDVSHESSSVTDAGSNVIVDAAPDVAKEEDAGLNPDAAAGVYASCKAAYDLYPNAPSGIYMIDLDGAGSQAPMPIFCDMTADGGGGWTLGLIKNSVHNGAYANFGAAAFGVESLSADPKEVSLVTPKPPAVAGWLDLNALDFTELVLEGFTNGVSTFRSVPIAKSSLRLQFGQSGYFLYNDANGYYWCGGVAAYTNNGTGQINKPTGAPDDCKGHTSLGDGWDFGGASVNTNLTVCGPGASQLMKTGPSTNFTSYTNPGAAQAFWVR